MIDLHSHTTRCCHAIGSMDDYVQRAKSLGLKEFGFSDHSPWMLHATGERYAMNFDELDGYVDEVKSLQAKHNENRSFAIRLGMEMDFIPSRLSQAREILSHYDWDYLTGSVHNLGFEHLQRPETYENWAIDDVCELYFHQLHEMIRANFCDVIAHLDLPKKMGHRPMRGLLWYLEPLIADLRESGMAVEINTSGFDNPAKEFMPGWELVKRLFEAGIPLTLGSDAHAPTQLGRHFDAVFKGLKEIGVKEIVSFERRKIIAFPLSDCI